MTNYPRHGWDGWLTPDCKFFPNSPSKLEFLRQRIDTRLPGVELSIHDSLAIEYLETHRPDLLAELDALRQSEGFHCWEEMDGFITPFMRQRGFRPIAAQEWDMNHPPGTNLNFPTKTWCA